MRIGQQDVGRLDVAMDDPALVGPARARATSAMISSAVGSSSRVCSVMRSPRFLPGDELEDEVGDAVVLVEFQQVDDVGVVGLGQQPGLLAESPQGLGAARPLGAQDLEGDDGSVRGVLGPVDGALASLAQQLEQAEPAQRLAVGTEEVEPAGGGPRACGRPRRLRP